MKIGRIEEVAIRDVWPREDKDFTRWLAKNLDMLGEKLGIKHLGQEGWGWEVETEVPVGSFKLDILARNTNSGEVVAIENQYAGTDHPHLGKLVTYSAGTKASTVVWIAQEFRDEHRAALDWLNETKESLDFVGVEVRVVRIGDSLPAPLFNLVGTPKVKPPRVRTEREEKYVQFWKPLLEELNARGWDIKTVNPNSSYAAGSGLRQRFGRFGRRVSFTGGRARVDLNVQGPDKTWNADAFERLRERQQQIDRKLALMGEPEWDGMDHAKLSRVSVYRKGNASIDDSAEDLEAIRTWMIDTLTRMPTLFRPHLEDVLENMGE